MARPSFLTDLPSMIPKERMRREFRLSFDRILEKGRGTCRWCVRERKSEAIEREREKGRYVCEEERERAMVTGNAPPPYLDSVFGKSQERVGRPK
jgi:hypothetical protein